MKTNLLDEALKLAAAGIRVVPAYPIVNGRCGCGTPTCKSPGKHPIGGAPAASADAATVRSKINGATAFLAVVPEGHFVVDEDPRNGGDKALAALEKLPATVTMKTGSGGHHYWFTGKPPPRPGKGIDIKSPGSLVVMPPSMHASGKQYRQEKGGAFAEAPAWLYANAPKPLSKAKDVWAHIRAKKQELGRKLRDGDGRFELLKEAIPLVLHNAASVEAARDMMETGIGIYFADHDSSPGKTEWRRYFESIAGKEQGKREAPEPQVRTLKAKPLALPSFGLGDAVVSEDTRKYLLQGVIVIPGAFNFGGTPKIGKSYLMMQWAICQALGLPYLGFSLKPLPVLYWDNENGTAEMQSRIKAMLKHLHPAPLQARHLQMLDVISFTPEQALPRGEEAAAAVEERIKAHKAKLVIIDGLMGIGAADEKRGNPNRSDYELVRSWQVLAHRLGCVIILMVPDRKMSAAQAVLEDKLPGTRGMAQASDGNLFLSATTIEGQTHAVFTGGVRGGVALDAGLRRDDAVKQWTLVGRGSDVIKQRPERAAVMNAIAKLGAKATGSAIAAALGRQVDGTNQLLKRMKLNDEIERNRDSGAWQKVGGE